MPCQNATAATILAHKGIDIINRMLLSNKSKRRHVPTRAKKVSVDIPYSLYQETAKVVTERRITTSVFVREAMERYLEELRRSRLERQLEEGYIAHAALGDKIHKEFEYVDAELA